MSRSHLLQQINKVAVIGAGPVGLAAAKFLLAEKTFNKIDVFEQRSRVGGVWNYTPLPDHIKSSLTVPAPQTNAHLPAEEPIWLPASSEAPDGNSRKAAAFVSPVYDELETNIPHFLMQYSEKSFPAESQLFPTHETVTTYLEEYAEEVKHLIRFQTQVLDVRPDETKKGAWVVKVRDLPSGTNIENGYDAVVVANGHYNVPFVPKVTGMEAWRQAYPGVISHAKLFRNAEPYKGKKVIVVGSAASGLDIGSQIGLVCKHPLLVSQKSVSYMSPGPAAYKEDLPEITEYLDPGTHDRAVRFKDGRVETGIDAILYCTGYLYSFPFLESLQPPIYDDGTRAMNVYQHFLYIEQPTLALPVLNQRIVPFPLAENQAAVFSRIWSGRLPIAPKDEMQKSYEDEIAKKGTAGEFHVLGFPDDVEFINGLYEWAEKAELREGLERGGKGKECRWWGDRERWTRERFPVIKKAFADRGETRKSIRTMEELGFDFEDWKNQEELGTKSLL